MRYSKKNVEARLQDWIENIKTNGYYAKSIDTPFNLGSIENGIMTEANDLLKTIKLCDKLSRQQFVETLIAKRDIAATLPVNKYNFNSQYGYMQVEDANSEKSFCYGKYLFNTNFVFRMFSEFYDIGSY